MMRSVIAALLLSVVLMTAACGGDPTPVNDPPAESTVTIDGKDWTCETITATPEESDCGELTQRAFDVYKDNLDGFVRSGDLGPAMDDSRLRYEDLAFAGLVACAYMGNGEDQLTYVDYIANEHPFNQLGYDSVQYVTFWLKANENMCPDLEMPDPGYRSSDLVVD